MVFGAGVTNDISDGSVLVCCASESRRSAIKQNTKTLTLKHSQMECSLCYNILVSSLFDVDVVREVWQERATRHELCST